MADFVIKPSTGNLKIQDDQDVDRIVIAPTTGVTTLSNPTLTAPTIASMANCTFPDGHILNFERGFLPTVAESVATDNPGTTTGLAVGITPSSASNKIVITASMGIISATTGGTVVLNIYSSLTSGIINTGTGVSNSKGVLYRHQTRWNDDGNHNSGGSFTIVDYPTTWTSGAITYTVYMWTESGTAHINRSALGENNTTAYGTLTSSTITAMEVKA